jgi:hypothetical protein
VQGNTYSICRYIYAGSESDMSSVPPRWLPTAAASVQSHARACGICGTQNDTGAGFLRVLRNPLPILIPPTAPHSLIILTSTLRSLDVDGVVK